VLSQLCNEQQPCQVVGYLLAVSGSLINAGLATLRVAYSDHISSAVQVILYAELRLLSFVSVILFVVLFISISLPFFREHQ
jgi:Na+-translocating ferredoxin:NAD+ oxidoreductase RnfE subunit